MENIKETASAGGTGAGNVATVNAPLGKGKVIRREKAVSADANEVGMFPKTVKEKAKERSLVKVLLPEPSSNDTA